MQNNIFTTADDPPSLDVEIRYEGKGANQGSIPMNALAESLDGFGRVYAVVGHFISTGEYALQLQALNAKVLVTKQEAKCFSVSGLLGWASTNGIFSGSVGAVFAAVLSLVYNRSKGSQEEMKHLRELFEKKLDMDNATTQRLLDTVDKLADALQPSARKSLAPIGEACEHIDLYEGGQKKSSMTLQHKEALAATDGDTISQEKTYSIVISELDRLKKTCKASFSTTIDADNDSEPERFSCELNDPAAMLNDNPYLNAFSNGSALDVRAKALIRNGVVVRLYISDTA